MIPEEKPGSPQEILAHHGVIGEKPLVVFSKKVSSKVSESLTKEMIDSAESNLIELSNRKL